MSGRQHSNRVQHSNHSGKQDPRGAGTAAYPPSTLHPRATASTLSARYSHPMKFYVYGAANSALIPDVSRNT